MLQSPKSWTLYLYYDYSKSWDNSKTPSAYTYVQNSLLSSRNSAGNFNCMNIRYFPWFCLFFPVFLRNQAQMWAENGVF